MYNTYRDQQTRMILNNVLKITLDNATYTNCIPHRLSQCLILAPEDAAQI